MTDRSARLEKEYAEVSTIVSSRKALRVLLIVRKRSKFFNDDPKSIIEDATSILKLEDPEPRFLVHVKGVFHHSLVFDLWNTEYDWMTADHIVNLPVVVIDYCETYVRTSIASPMIRNEVNDGVARNHRDNGWDAYPPYIEDHTGPDPPLWMNPRDLYWKDGTIPPGVVYSPESSESPNTAILEALWRSQQSDLRNSGAQDSRPHDSCFHVSDPQNLDANQSATTDSHLATPAAESGEPSCPSTRS